MHTPRTAFQGIAPGRAALWLGLAVWTVSLLRTPLPQLGGSFFHLIDLVFHEAGHVIFAPFGSFMMSLGGSLFQVMVPLICAWAFLFQQGDPFCRTKLSGWNRSISPIRTATAPN